MPHGGTTICSHNLSVTLLCVKSVNLRTMMWFRPLSLKFPFSFYKWTYILSKYINNLNFLLYYLTKINLMKLLEFDYHC